MAISPFSARPGTPESEGRRARLVIMLATLGIAASLFAYAISPSVRHAVGHAAHSVRHAMGRVFDNDRPAHRAPPAHRVAPAHRATPAHARPVHPLHSSHAAPVSPASHAGSM
jgi:hypothetical protein